MVLALDRVSMYEILLAVDRDEDRAREQARTVERMPLDGEETRITLVHVFENNLSGASVTQVAAVRRAREILEDAGHEVHLDGTSGHPASEIVDLALEREADLVVLAGRKRSKTGKLLFGSTSQEVLLDLGTPVLVCEAADE